MSFPLNSNQAYIKSTGERSTLGAEMGGGTGPTIPTPAAGDTGKVLTVGEDGTLEWDTAGTGGGDKIILDYFESFTTSGSHEYTHEVVIEETGNYMILIGGFLTSATTQINDVTQDNTFDDSGAYLHWYQQDSKALTANDTIDIALSSSGKTVFMAYVIKLADV